MRPDAGCRPPRSKPRRTQHLTPDQLAAMRVQSADRRRRTPGHSLRRHRCACCASGAPGGAVRPADLVAMVYRPLGIDPHMTVNGRAGHPIPLPTAASRCKGCWRKRRRRPAGNRTSRPRVFLAKQPRTTPELVQNFPLRCPRRHSFEVQQLHGMQYSRWQAVKTTKTTEFMRYSRFRSSKRKPAETGENRCLRLS